MPKSNIQDIIEALHPLEVRVIPFLKDGISFESLMDKTGMKDVEVMRALQWLQNKEVIELKESVEELVSLDENGEKYLKEGLPEKRLLNAIENSDLTLDEIKNKTDLSDEELSISLGALKSKAAIDVAKNKDQRTIVKITEQGKKLIEKTSFEEQFLQKRFPLKIASLRDEEKFALENLKKRKKIIKLYLEKTKTTELTELGKKLVKVNLDKIQVIDKLSSSVIKSGEWKHKNFRRYDIKTKVPSIFAGKKQHYRAYLDEIRKKLMAMGFTEMTGPIIETDFWNMDALFMPQFHSARDIHDAYYIKEPKYGKVDELVLEKVKAAHEHGYKTGSKGWQYAFDVNKTKRHLLRTQGTALSARTLASKELKVPGRYFAIARCFRYDVVDATHNVDFFQTEGIVVEDGLNFRHLRGLLKMFAEEFAQTDQIKITPAYFPFTEPSASLYAKHPEMGWIELAGSGIFRKEVTAPLGVDVPVLAWGIGIDRMAMFHLGIKDIRKLFSNDLEFLRSVKVI